MRPTLVLLMVLTALTHGIPQKTPEAHNATVQETPKSGKTLAEETSLTELHRIAKLWERETSS